MMPPSRNSVEKTCKKMPGPHQRVPVGSRPWGAAVTATWSRPRPVHAQPRLTLPAACRCSAASLPPRPERPPRNRPGLTHSVAWEPARFSEDEWVAESSAHIVQQLELARALLSSLAEKGPVGTPGHGWVRSLGAGGAGAGARDPADAARLRRQVPGSCAAPPGPEAGAHSQFGGGARGCLDTETPQSPGREGCVLCKWRLALGSGGARTLDPPGLSPSAMPLPDTLFCAQQIHIPPELPDILKQFTKAAIRTQPVDLLQWSAGYFSALSRGDPLPIKDRIEMPVATQKNDTGLTQGLLKVLHKQCSHKEYVELADLEKKWKNLCLPVEKFRAILALDPCEDKIEWMKFLALGCSALGGSLNTAMKNACEILTADPEGGPAQIPFQSFAYIYQYLSRLDPELPAEDTESYLATLKEKSESRKNGMIGLSDFFILKRTI